MEQALSNNSLAFIALCNEYCYAVENAAQSEPRAFVETMLRLLPRIYIAATDLNPERPLSPEDAFIDSYLDEDYYESARLAIENLLGPDDVFLETFEEDMKYSDTPVSASISEGVCDIFQVLYNFIAAVKDSPAELTNLALIAVADDFKSYWSQKLVNLLRPLNHVRYEVLGSDDSDDDPSVDGSIPEFY
ncbi:MAG: DUF5063 domain-containing protein [Duncaniella sp.]|nr:DUF5063 domain-containing protein [Duncaniella sp.]